MVTLRLETNRMTPLTRDQVVSLIADAVKMAGGQAKFSREYDLSEPYICNVLSGRTPPAKRICAVVGVVPVTEKTWRMTR